MITSNFQNIVTATVAAQGLVIESRACPDQYLGPLAGILETSDFSVRIPAVLRPTQPCLIMILESPHIDEFNGALGPAKGFTGEMIRQHLRQSVSLPNLEDFGLILVNAIQYQCSLGVSTERYRDAIFRATWDAGWRLSFGERIKQLVRTDDVVVNCCTKGNDFAINTPLRSLVEAEVRRVLPGIRSIRRMHPASWRVSSWIEAEWRYSATEKTETQMSTNSGVATDATMEITESTEFHKKRMFAAKVPRRDDQVPDRSPAAILAAVNENVQVRGAACTILVMADGSQRHMKISTFDPDGLITKKAKKLVGLAVQITCWNPKGSPGRWSSQGYFNDVFKAI
jgi:hypothetical protein